MGPRGESPILSPSFIGLHPEELEPGRPAPCHRASSSRADLLLVLPPAPLELLRLKGIYSLGRLLI